MRHCAGVFVKKKQTKKKTPKNNSRGFPTEPFPNTVWTGKSPYPRDVRVWTAHLEIQQSAWRMEDGGRSPHALVDGVEPGVLRLVLHEVLETAEDQRPHEDQGEEEAQVLVARLHGVGNGLKSHGSFGKFEDPHYPRYPEHLHDPPEVTEGILLLLLLLLCYILQIVDALKKRKLHKIKIEEYSFLICPLSDERLVWDLKVWRRHEEQIDVVGSDGEGIHNVHGSFHEGDLAGA